MTRSEEAVVGQRKKLIASVVLDIGLLEALDAQAALEARSRSFVVRRALASELRRLERERGGRGRAARGVR